MPTYLYQCEGACRKQFEAWRSIAERNDPILHCDAQASRLINAPMVAPLFESYRAIGGDRRVIRTRQEHQGFLREFGYVEVGNDASIAPPPISDEEFSHDREQRLGEMRKEAAEIARVSEQLAIIPENS